MYQQPMKNHIAVPAPIGSCANVRSSVAYLGKQREHQEH